MSYVQVDAKLFARLEWLSEEEGGTKTSKTGPVQLYIDGETIIEEVTDITALRKGDHCLVGLNATRRINPTFDWLVWKLGQWDVLRLYHHFVMVDDVSGQEELQSGGVVPLNPAGEPAMICEFSNTPLGAFKALLAEGLWSLVRPRTTWLRMAPFQKLALADYTETAGTKGIFRVLQMPPLTPDQRERIVLDAHKLLTSYQPYNLLWRNCESAAFALSPHSRRWVSPEVPMVLWNLLRMGLALGGTLALRRIPAASKNGSRGLAFLFHGLVTCPSMLQSLIQLVRAAVNLTGRRRELGERSFHHLLTKEVGRTALVSYLLGNVLAYLPLWVRRGTVGKGAATALALGAFTLAEMCYSILSRAFILLMKIALGGVPIITFFDAIDYEFKARPDEGRSPGGGL